jgi:hypothetical protein
LFRRVSVIGSGYCGAASEAAKSIEAPAKLHIIPKILEYYQDIDCNKVDLPVVNSAANSFFRTGL